MTGSETAIPGGVTLGKAAAPSSVTLTAAELAAEIGGDELSASRLLAVASVMVEQYAPEAPAALQNEAVIRFAGYLAGSAYPFYGAVASETVGPVNYSFPVNHADAFRRSGAAMLLTRYRVRRAGLAG